MKQNVTKKAARIFLIIAAISLLSLAAGAQTQLKVAIINSQKAFDQSTEGKKAVAILQEREDQMKAELKKMDEELRRLKEKLASQKLTLSTEAQSQLQLEIAEKEAARQKYEQEANRDFEQFKAQMIKRIRDEMLTVIDDLIKEKGYDLVFELSSSGLIHYKPELDITEEVIKRYEASKITKK
ncbi:MAG: OmpH family outer membrane protein [Candidatus Saccharicenans sp.]